MKTLNIILDKARLKARDKAGFTLVEVSIAALIAGISLAGIWGLIHWLVYASHVASMRVEATALAAEKMEEILTYGGTAGDDMVGPFQRFWDIEKVSDEQIDVQVAVRWNDPRERADSDGGSVGGETSSGGGERLSGSAGEDPIEWHPRNSVVLQSALVNEDVGMMDVPFSSIFTGPP